MEVQCSLSPRANIRLRFHACRIDTPRRREKKPADEAGKVSGRKRSDRERQGNLFDSPTRAKIVQLRHHYAPELRRRRKPPLWRRRYANARELARRGDGSNIPSPRIVCAPINRGMK